MDRRNFVKAAATAGVGLAAVNQSIPILAQEAAMPTHQFKLKYAPHFGMVQHHAGSDPIDQLKFMADTGFTALEDNGMKGRDVALQEAIAAEMQRLEMTMGVFVASGKQEFIDSTLQDMRDSVEVAKRVNATWCTVVPGSVDQGLEPDYQTANCIDLLKRCAEICEPSGLIMVLEPLNWYANHPGLFLTGIPQAYQICRAVGSPSCKILDDLYHQQVTEGNLIPNIDRAWSEIAYFQVGDNPGRKEPGTGEINYRNVFKHIADKGFEGIVGMEHGLSEGGKEGEQKLIDAYVSADSF